MFVGLNDDGLVHDFYYPYVGQENLTTSRSVPHKVGVWVDGSFSWLDSPEWQKTVVYQKDCLVSDVEATHSKLGIKLNFTDAVDSHINAFLRSIKVTNLHKDNRTVKLFMHQVFEISHDGRGDTAFYEPEDNYIFDYKGHTALIIYAEQNRVPFTDWAVGNHGIEGKAGTFKDAEDGELSKNLVEHGGVDSVVSIVCTFDDNHETTINYWIAAGTDHNDAANCHQLILTSGVNARIEQTSISQTAWLKTADESMVHIDNEEDKTAIKRSLLIVKAHIDDRGSILASGDSSIYNYGRDYYCYCWPRDGAYAVWPMIKLGYSEEARNFFDFCNKVIHPSGYLQHKFQPDSSYGSTWHPLMQDHHKELAIQEDETAITLIMLAEYVNKFDDKEYFKSVYDTLVRPSADFLAYYVDAETGLPHASYDLWEQTFLTSSYTSVLVCKALRMIAGLAQTIMDDKHAVKWTVSAEGIEGQLHQFYKEDLGYYVKGFYANPNNEVLWYEQLDISTIYALQTFGSDKLVKSAELAASVQKAKDLLEDQTPGGGFVRYNDDGYLRTNPNLLGNPWFICTYWMAQNYLINNRQDKADALIDWAKSRQLPSGVMSEQVNPETGASVGVAPLTWSHAEHINTLLSKYS